MVENKVGDGRSGGRRRGWRWLATRLAMVSDEVGDG